uniref:Uncharacterized protein n=1 Tax=Globisporangium ultimum (strain ATCC 200006 / CBS 805.95 / DAOM BR144) TaxID=431595 RepID=K3WB95_GLOUD
PSNCGSCDRRDRRHRHIRGHNTHCRCCGTLAVAIGHDGCPVSMSLCLGIHWRRRHYHRYESTTRSGRSAVVPVTTSTRAPRTGSHHHRRHCGCRSRLARGTASVSRDGIYPCGHRRNLAAAYGGPNRLGRHAAALGL